MRFATSTIAIVGLIASAYAAPVAEPVAEPQLGAVVSSATGAVSTVVSNVAATVTGTVNTVLALLSGSCTSEWQCTITVGGPLVNLIADAANVPLSAQASISAWCYNGDCYAAAQTNLGIPAPFAIVCTTPNVCTGTIFGNVTAAFANGKQVSVWGWATPSGYCTKGVCYASISAVGDPCYK